MKDSVFKKLRGRDRLPNSRRGMKKNVSAGSLRNSTAVSMSVSFKNSKHSKCAFFNHIAIAIHIAKHCAIACKSHLAI